MNKAQRHTIARWISIVIRVLMAGAIALFLIREEWASAVYAGLIFLLMLSPILLREKWDIFIPFELEVASALFIFLTLFLGSLQNFYEAFPWWDGVLHFGSGFLLGLFGFVFIYVLNGENRARISLSPGFIAIFSVMFSSSIGVVWEIYEFAYDSITGGKMMESGLPDTMGDLIVNLIGSIIIAVIAYIWMKRRKRIPLTPKRIH